MASRTPGTVDVTIRVDKSHAGRLEEIVRALETSGLTGVQRHDRFLTVNGSIAADGLDRLRSIEGVASVRPDTTYGTRT